MSLDYDTLIQREMDGDLDPDEQAVLVAAVAGDAALRARRESLLALGDDLRALGWRAPAADLPDRVMEQIGRATAAPLRPARPRPALRSRVPDRRQLLAFAAGLAVMFVAGRLVAPPGDAGLDPGRAAGTLLPVTAPAIDRGSFAGATARAEAAVERDHERLYLRARGNADTPEPLRIEWQDTELSVVAIRGDGPSALELGPGFARFVQTAPGPFTLEMEFQLRRPQATSGEVRLRFEQAADPPLILGAARD